MLNGRHDIVRVPRAALGVASTPSAAETRYLDVKQEWEQQRVLFFFFPSGLVLYWFTNTLRSILQQWRINTVVEREATA